MQHQLKLVSNSLSCTILLFLVSIMASCQSLSSPTDTLMVEGAIEHSFHWSLADLEKYKSVNIPDLVITNHLGEPRKKELI